MNRAVGRRGRSWSWSGSVTRMVALGRFIGEFDRKRADALTRGCA